MCVGVIGVLDGHGREVGKLNKYKDQFIIYLIIYFIIQYGRLIGKLASQAGVASCLDFCRLNHKQLFSNPYEFMVNCVNYAHAGIHTYIS